MKLHTLVVIDIATGDVIEDRWENYSGPVALCKTKSTTEVPPPSAQENEMYSVAANMGRRQLEAMLAQGGFQNMLYGLAPGLIEGLAGDLGLERDPGGTAPTVPGSGGSPHINAPSLSAAEMIELQGLQSEDAWWEGLDWRGKMDNISEQQHKIEPRKQRIAELQAKKDSGPAAGGAGSGAPTYRAAGSSGRIFDNSGTGTIDDELAGIQLDRIRSGGSATPEDMKLINESVSAQLSAGQSDIMNFYKGALGDLKQELAPSLGLRPEDSPILDRGGKLATEATRQFGNLVSNLRGQAATKQLEFPLQRGQVMDTMTGNMRQFQEQLRQQAFANRANMLANIGGSGLGLAGQGGAGSGIGHGGSNGGGTTTANNPYQAAAGIGSLMYGLSAMMSSRSIKENKQKVDEAAILEALALLDVESWNYIGDDRVHIGPYAEDFKEKFGVGDGKTIHMVDAIGVLAAAVKALARQVEKQHAAV